MLDDVVELLQAQFGALVSASAIAAVVRQAESDLLGQATPGAMAELVHRLAAYRLGELTGG